MKIPKSPDSLIGRRVPSSLLQYKAWVGGDRNPMNSKVIDMSLLSLQRGRGKINGNFWVCSWIVVMDVFLPISEITVIIFKIHISSLCCTLWNLHLQLPRASTVKHFGFLLLSAYIQRISLRDHLAISHPRSLSRLHTHQEEHGMHSVNSATFYFIKKSI